MLLVFENGSLGFVVLFLVVIMFSFGLFCTSQEIG